MDKIHKPTHTTTHTDIQNNAFVYRVMPRSFHPYISLMRVDRPVGVYLLFLPCLWGVLAGFSLYPISLFQLFYLIILFALGSFIMRGAGCVINDLWDRDFDRQVERTKHRPLANGSITISRALVFLAGLLSLGLLILLQLPLLAILIGFIFMVPVSLYPLAKRITWYPQFMLGVTFNAGVLIGGAAVITTLTATNIAPLILLYAAAIFWTIGYDTVYAHQDSEDDRMIGVKSTAIKFGVRSFEIILGVYLAMFICLAACLFMLSAHGLSWIAYIVACLYVLWNHYGWNPNDPADCLNRFKTHITAGWLMALIFAIHIIS